MKNGPTKNDLKKKNPGTKHSARYHLIVNYTSTASDLEMMPRDEICIARSIEMEFECLLNGFCLIRWILSIECSASHYFEAEGLCQAVMLRFD